MNEVVSLAPVNPELRVSALKSHSWIWIGLGTAIIIAGIGGGVYYFNKLQNQSSQPPDYSQPIYQPTDAVIPSLAPAVSDTQPSIPPKTAAPENYQIPAGWQKYRDAESGITIYYPPQYIAKYNPNRGFGVNYAAGSYLVDKTGRRLLDFYKFGYDGGSRRQSFYNAVEFDGPEDMSKFTVSTTDVTLNGRAYLKLTSNYWTTIRSDEGNRVFFLTPLGNQIYYFTYPASLESNPTDYKNILIIIATGALSAGTGPNPDQYLFCYQRPDSGNINSSWEAKIENGDMVVIQRTDKALKQQIIDKSKIAITANPQNSNSNYFSITDFEIYVDSSRKISYQDAFVIKIKKADVDRIIQDTPPSISSVAIITSINGGVETAAGKTCKADLYGYYAPKP